MRLVEPILRPHVACLHDALRLFSRGMWTGLAILLLLSTVHAEPKPLRQSDRVAAVSYRTLVNRYTNGSRDAVASVALMTRSQLNGVVQLVFSSNVPGGPWTRRELQAAVVLHAEVVRLV